MALSLVTVRHQGQFDPIMPCWALTGEGVFTSESSLGKS
jgi:hypothetical protein